MVLYLIKQTNADSASLKVYSNPSITNVLYWLKFPLPLMHRQCFEMFLHNRYITIFFENFLSHSNEKLRGRTLLCFRKFLISKNFMNKKGERECHIFPLKVCCLRGTEKLRKGTLLCFRKFLVSKNFMDKKGGGRGCHDSKS